MKHHDHNCSVILAVLSYYIAATSKLSYFAQFCVLADLRWAVILLVLSERSWGRRG